MSNLDYLKLVSEADARALRRAFEAYGDSWMKRGGTGAFFVTVRKADRLAVQTRRAASLADRIEERLAPYTYDLFAALAADGAKPDGVLDDIRDLRRYLLLWEAEALDRGLIPRVELSDRDDDPPHNALPCD